MAAHSASTVNCDRGASEGRRTMFTKILAANDGSAGAFAALQAAIDLAGKYGAELHMISVAEIPHRAETIDEVEGEREEAAHRLARVVERSRQLAAGQGLSLEPHLVPGHPVSSIVEFVLAHDFDLLVVGFMGHSALYNRLIGSTTDRLVDHAPCAVLVVKSAPPSRLPAAGRMP
jgi:nucleotide-binding universal stress UspA family protein